MSAKTGHGSGSKKLAIEGDLTIYRAAALKTKLVEALKGASQLELNLSRVGEVDTAGVQLLLMLKREAHKSHKTLRLVGHSQATLEALDLFNLGATFGDPVVIKRADRRAKSADGGRK